MRRHDKTVAMLKANMLFEQRCNKILNEELDNLDEGLKDIANKFMGYVKEFPEKVQKKIDTLKGFRNTVKNKIGDKPGELADDVYETGKEAISKALGFAKDQWEDEENREKVKNLYEKVKEAIKKLAKSASTKLNDADSRKKIISSLGLGSLGALIGAVAQFVFGFDFDWSVNWWPGDWLDDGAFNSEVVLKGGFLLKTSVVLLILRFIASVLDKVMKVKEFITPKSKDNNKEVSESLYEAKLNECFDLMFGNDNYKLI